MNMSAARNKQPFRKELINISEYADLGSLKATKYHDRAHGLEMFIYPQYTSHKMTEHSFYPVPQALSKKPPPLQELDSQNRLQQLDSAWESPVNTPTGQEYTSFIWR